MKSFPEPSKHAKALTVQAGQRLMLRCAGGYIFASATAAALGFAGMGRLSLGAVVFLLLLAALMLAAGLLCSALGVMDTDEPRRGRSMRR